MIVTDKTGFEILQVIKKASSFNQWMFKTISPFCHGSILEIGSGTGNISEFFIKTNYKITLSDINSGYVDLLRNQFANCKNVTDILAVDLQLPDFSKKYTALHEKYDTIVLLNVLEHLKDEDSAISNCRYLLKEKGTLIILVPAFMLLYSPLDKELGHYRRYALKQLKNCLIRNEMQIQKSFYFNAMGILAWLYGKVFALKTIPGGEMSFFDKLVPVAKICDKILFHKTGLSAICISKK
ncbi:MAG: class I SAM-dependent methyltransferase [Bacteroidetes bacterium]|nr:class I SAM-dependent methyltransferase [Bacteroidota bacterium]